LLLLLLLLLTLTLTQVAEITVLDDELDWIVTLDEAHMPL
jgi:hypothetical protein